MSDDMKLAVGWPLTDDWLHAAFVASWSAMNKVDYEFLLPKVTTRPIDVVRNDIVEQALQRGCTHLLWMDTDQVYPPDTLTKLLSHNLDMCGVLVHRRYPPFDPILYRGSLGKYKHVPYEECYSKKLLEVDATGMGCALINLRCMVDVPPPWYLITKTEDGRNVGEDIYFCSQVKQSGYRIWVDTSIEVDHLTTYRVNKQTAQLYRKMKNFEWTT